MSKLSWRQRWDRSRSSSALASSASTEMEQVRSSPANEESSAPTARASQTSIHYNNTPTDHQSHTDCLDRTNVVQDVLSRFALENFILNADPSWQNSDSALWNSHRVLWAENGDALSKQYTGTGALNTSYTRSGKKSFAGLLSDGMKSVGRVYQSQFVDGGKQKAIDALLVSLVVLAFRGAS